MKAHMPGHCIRALPRAPLATASRAALPSSAAPGCTQSVPAAPSASPAADSPESILMRKRAATAS